MKTIFRNIWVIFQSMGQARAAAAMARSGDIKSAQKIMIGD